MNDPFPLSLELERERRDYTPISTMIIFVLLGQRGTEKEVDRGFTWGP